MTTAAVEPPQLVRVDPRAWLMLCLGVVAQTAATVLITTPAFLIPLLSSEGGLSLAQAGTLSATPMVGMVLTLVAWGALADRVGERWVIAGGVGLGALAALGAAVLADGFVALGIFFVLCGAASASPNAASGRLVVGWFPKHKRGLAMGIRQISQPLGVAIAALVIPSLASAGGIPGAMFASVVFCGVLAVHCGILLRDPVRPARPVGDAGVAALANPYRGSAVLWRIHAVSVLLVVPQYVISTFGLVWLITEQRMSPLAAGAVIGISQLIGAAGRIAVGVLSDAVGSRMRPLRWVACAAVAVMLLLAVLDWLEWPLAIAVLVIATTISVADNGLAFTAVAEIAGSHWSGRALGTQNTGQFIAAAAVGPLAGALIGVVGFPLTFAAAALCALVSVPLVPRNGDTHH